MPNHFHFFIRVDANAIATFKYVSEYIIGNEGKNNCVLVVTSCRDDNWITENAKNDEVFAEIVQFCQCGSVEVDFPPIDKVFIVFIFHI